MKETEAETENEEVVSEGVEKLADIERVGERIESITFVRRSTRLTKKPTKLGFDSTPSTNYLLLTVNGEPESYYEALRHSDAIKWELAMKEALSSLEKNETWRFTNLPKRKRALQNKWIFRIKEEVGGTPLVLVGGYFVASKRL